MANIDFSVTTVPAAYQLMVNRLRKFVNDEAEKNILTGVQESTDFELFMALEDAWDELNYTYEPVDLHFDSIDKAPWAVLRMGALLNILTSKTILSARNTLTYSDSGGIQVKDNDEFGRYTTIYNYYLAEYRRRATAAKRSLNIEGSYGGVHSEYNELY